MSVFWDKVHDCDHEERTEHDVSVPCSTTGCRGTETRCAKCGVYLTSCPCGFCDGLDGWPWSKRSKPLRSYR